MPNMKKLSVDSLVLDLDNFRMVHQKNEIHVINAMISVNPDGFWALMDSILDDGYHPTENIIVLITDGKNIVKEGNRRIAVLKIIHGYVKNIDLTDSVEQKIKGISKEWKKENTKVPCTIYTKSESDIVDKIVSLIHAKGEKAGRDKWTAVARARYERDKKGKSEPGLDLLEKYLKNGKNLSQAQAERWSGDYPLTVLNEAIQKISPHLGYSSLKDISEIYPKKHKRTIDKILYDIGIQNLGFKNIRDKDKFFGDNYDITPKETSEGTAKDTTAETSGSKSDSDTTKTVTTSIDDPKTVSKKLEDFKPKGKGREKVVTLLKEIKKLNINKHPHSFCFLLRSMFDISAKAYCDDHKSSGGPKLHKKNGSDKTLAVLLRDITKHITKNNSDKVKIKELHGAITELAKPDGILSVTSLNQLVHNPSFSIIPKDICILFGNIFPLLEEMNR